jgi:hypothetical protein
MLGEGSADKGDRFESGLGSSSSKTRKIGVIKDEGSEKRERRKARQIDDRIGGERKMGSFGVDIRRDRLQVSAV